MNETLVKWYQYSYQIYALITTKDISKINVTDIEEVKRENSPNFSKLGGIFDIAFCNGEFVLCKDQKSTSEQSYISFNTMNHGFGVCQKIPPSCSFTLTDQIILQIIKQEADAIGYLTSLDPNFMLAQKADHFY